MNEKELEKKVKASVYRQCRERGFATPVDILMEIGVLSQKNYNDWRFGKVPYLEKVCTINLHKLSSINRHIRLYAAKCGYKPSFTYYKRWGVKKKKGTRPLIPLRFSKTGNPQIERNYATHYVDSKLIDELKDAKKLQKSEQTDPHSPAQSSVAEKNPPLG